MTLPVRRLARATLAAILAATLSACASTALKQGQAAEDLRDYDLAVASYQRAVRDHPRDRDAQLGLERSRLRASEAHLLRGRRLSSQGRDQDALVELQLANELNPTSEEVETELRRVRIALREQLSRPENGETRLESLIESTRDLPPAGDTLPDTTLPSEITTGSQLTVRSLYLLLARLGHISVTFDPDVEDLPAPASLLNGMTLTRALDEVGRATHTFYHVTAPSAIVVAPDTPPKRRQYTDEVLREFTVQNADLKETIDALRIVADTRYIAPVTGTNMILVRDTPERLNVIGRFLSAFDKARPEVVVDVEVLEVDRTALREYGLQIASPGSPGIDGSADVNSTNGISLSTLRTLSQSNVLMTNIPALYYRLLKTDSRTRILANPHIRITDGTTATASFGQRVPVPRLTITPIAQGGAAIQPQTQFDYETIGVNIGITPRTHPNDDVTLALNIELSSLGAAGYNGLPTFGQRNVTTSIRLKDGETNILAGLIREDERTEHETIPGLGDVPVLGKLFARNHKEAEQTDVVVMLTPHIVRVLDLSAEDLRPLRLPLDTGPTASLGVRPVQAPPRAPSAVPAPTPSGTTPSGETGAGSFGGQ
jgi:general secretion pathway protein D